VLGSIEDESLLDSVLGSPDTSHITVLQGIEDELDQLVTPFPRGRLEK
jgi:hypothetical protein